MMLRSERLQVVLAVEERKEQAALERMGEARKQVDQHQEQLANLNQYQDEYRQQMRQSQQGAIAVTRLQAWQAFIAQLDQVIRHQEQQLAQARELFEARRKDWHEAWERRRGMEKYIESCRQQEARERDAREQKAADEAAGRAFARRHR
jgi:flagellar FliJ protein